MTAPERIVAIDWSGNAQRSGQRKHIWSAELCGEDIELRDGWTRETICEWLVNRLAGDQRRVVIGFDFAFSLPLSFFLAHGFGSAEQLWHAASEHGETWLKSCKAPFWGRAGKKCPTAHKDQGFRATDKSICVRGTSPKSPFQIGGAGAVGTGSIRGMSTLARLKREGFSIWPFDPPQSPLIVEIYPRLLTGPVHKSREGARSEYLERPEFSRLHKRIRKLAEGSEDAFDALVSAIKMRDHADSFANLKQATEPDERLEGKIWVPSATEVRIDGPSPVN